jgi:chorismate synthase
VNNSFGDIFRITSFGESHGRCVGILVDGCPAGLSLSEEDIQKEVDKRKPVAQAGQTARMEEDKIEILSGVFEGKTTGAPIGLLVWNKDTDSTEYEKMKFLPRPGHADYPAFVKYGGFSDYRGGGRFSGRVTIGMVMAGAIAKKLLEIAGIEVMAHTVQIGDIKAGVSSPDEIRRYVYDNSLRCADKIAATAMSGLIKIAGKEGDSVGGVIEGLALNVPAGLGEPYFNTVEGELSRALFAIPAVKGVEFGAGFSVAIKRGSESNDPWVIKNSRIIAETNNAGGILGGVSDGMPVIVRVAIKPTPSISKVQKTVDFQKYKKSEISLKGRHDVCLVPRAVIVVESAIAITLCDFALKAGLIARVLK